MGTLFADASSVGSLLNMYLQLTTPTINAFEDLSDPAHPVTPVSIIRTLRPVLEP